MLETRTTCAVEATNGVVGRGLPGNSNFFNFIVFIKKQELSKSIKLRNQFLRLVTKKRQRNKHMDVQIRQASQALEAGKLTADEFVDLIASCKQNKYEQPTKRPADMDSDSDCSEAESLDSAYSTVSNSSSQASSQTSATQSSMRTRTESVNMCALCSIEETNVLFIPCTHALVCNKCFECYGLRFCMACKADVTSHKIYTLPSV